MDYAKITEITLTEIKTIRKSVIEENWQRELATARASSYFDFGGFELTEYDGIVNQCKLVSYKMVINIVLSLFEKKGIRASYIYDEEDSMDCIIAPHYDKNVIYIFHEFMKVATWNPETKKRFENNYNVDYCIGVSFVRTGAYSVVFNHTDNIKDPMRGTNQLSFRDFFLFYFGTDEYSRFESAMKQFEKNARDAIGMRVVKTLHPAAMHYYKRILNLRFKKNVEECKICFSTSLDSQQISCLENQFLNQSVYTCLLSSKDFATSYITAEWLFDVMKDGGEIDYTSIILGYYKSIEQLLYLIITFHKEEGRKLKRRYLENDIKYSYINKSGKRILDKYVPIDDDNINEGRLDTTTGAMINSFYCFADNDDIFRNEITEKTKSFIKTKLKKFTPLRNGFLHKDNISQDMWGQVEQTRTFVNELLFLVLGSIKFSASDLKDLSVKQIQIDEYSKLCEYINDSHELRIFYIGNEPYVEGNDYCGICNVHAETAFDSYGECEYGKISFTIIGDKNKYYFSRTELPKFIYSSSLNMKDVSKLFKSPKELIFKEGLFCGNNIISEKY